MGTHGRASYADCIGKLRGGQRATVHERTENLSPSALADDGGDPRNVGSFVHGSIPIEASSTLEHYRSAATVEG
ncbi:hypothetical protein GCM10011487_35450 [Steroidobacter agaridevorans]|uniref:Uncharacterized protein n=1 Tax=Steroidobacter agaridevorans TaxID=2695856 RepID=A0A829YE05_9GAMM|nr:hypothetical protein GCM10011487_35450 [Steroidobacter agaridevorans]